MVRAYKIHHLSLLRHHDYNVKTVCSSDEEATATISLIIKFRNRTGEKRYTFTVQIVLAYENLCFTSTGDSTVALTLIGYGGYNEVATLYISRDNETWQLWDYSAVSLADGEKLYMYGTEFRNGSTKQYQFVLQGKIKVSGDLVALNNGSSVMNNYQYAQLFQSCLGLIDVSELKFPNKVGDSCYINMFYKCTNLVKVPEILPATRMRYSCYNCMFYGCTALVEAPKLPATELSGLCYNNMFNGCTSLTKAPDLPATKVVYLCYRYMFNGCSKLNYVKALFTSLPSDDNHTEYWLKGVASSGTFVKNAAATWNVVGVDGVPEGWTVQTVTV